MSLEACIARLIDQWDPLTLYFIDAYHLENIDSAGPILDFLNSSIQKSYILFLGYILQKINIVNKFFQRKDVILHKIKNVLHTFLKQIAALFLNRNYVAQNSPSIIDPMNVNQFVGLDNLNLGNAANNFINSPDTPEFTADDKIIVKNNCLNFLKTLCTQIKNRFNNLHNNYYDALECIDPENALSLANLHWRI